MSRHDSVQVAVLGPLRIRHDDGDWHSITAPMERVLLALLVSRAGQHATNDWLIDHLWRNGAPQQATNTLQTYVSHLRPMLEPDRVPGQPWRVLRRESNGYLIDGTNLDFLTFADLVEQGMTHVRAGDLVAADAALTRALGMWQGEDAFADVTETDPVRRMADDLGTQRLRALKAWSQVRITTGFADTVLSDLSAAGSQHPDDEELVRLMMLALHGTGRTADALRLYDRTSRRLRTELGADLGLALRETHGQLLEATARPVREVAQLVVNPEETRSETEPEDRPSEPVSTAPPRANRRWSLAAAAAAAATAAGAVVLVGLLVGLANFPPALGEGSRLNGALAEDIYTEFDLVMQAGNAHDLDVGPGQKTVLPTGLQLGTPLSNRGDLYRERGGTDRLGGWPTRPDYTGYNTFEPVGRDTSALECRTRADTGQGNMPVLTAQVGDKVCLHTHDDRWALLTITELPQARLAAMTVHVIVLKSAKDT